MSVRAEVVTFARKILLAKGSAEQRYQWEVLLPGASPAAGKATLSPTHWGHLDFISLFRRGGLQGAWSHRAGRGTSSAPVGKALRLTLSASAALIWTSTTGGFSKRGLQNFKTARGKSDKTAQEHTGQGQPTDAKRCHCTLLPCGPQKPLIKYSVLSGWSVSIRYHHAGRK